MASKVRTDAQREQTRYTDIIKSINSTEQFIKAKQAIAAQDYAEKYRKSGRNVRKGKHRQHLSEVPALIIGGQ
jgi:hypothetical protein